MYVRPHARLFLLFGKAERGSFELLALLFPGTRAAVTCFAGSLRRATALVCRVDVFGCLREENAKRTCLSSLLKKKIFIEETGRLPTITFDGSITPNIIYSKFTMKTLACLTLPLKMYPDLFAMAMTSKNQSISRTDMFAYNLRIRPLL